MKANRSHTVKRTVFELILGLLMLGLVAGIQMYMIEKPLRLEASAGIGTAGVNGDGDREPCVVLDAGHGAADPGKVGCNQAREKDINLSIVKKLKTALEKEKVRVVLTRESDEPLYQPDSPNKKMADMNRRIEIMEGASPDLVVSIHQNSYHDPSVCGPQVFYYHASEKGKRAAEILQASFDEVEEINNRRKPKANDNYYLLLHTSMPMVIAECGFLSNPDEAALLIQEAYQEKLAKALTKGILKYLNRNEMISYVF